jgi:hypothetical protein
VRVEGRKAERRRQHGRHAACTDRCATHGYAQGESTGAWDAHGALARNARFCRRSFVHRDGFEKYDSLHTRGNGRGLRAESKRYGHSSTRERERPVKSIRRHSEGDVCTETPTFKFSFVTRSSNLPCVFSLNSFRRFAGGAWSGFKMHGDREAEAT